MSKLKVTAPKEVTRHGVLAAPDRDSLENSCRSLDVVLRRRGLTGFNVDKVFVDTTKTMTIGVFSPKRIETLPEMWHGFQVVHVPKSLFEIREDYRAFRLDYQIMKIVKKSPKLRVMPLLDKLEEMKLGFNRTEMKAALFKLINAGKINVIDEFKLVTN